MPVRVMSVNELIGGGDKEIRVAESLHDEERLRVAGHALLSEPGTERLLVVESLPLDASIPCVHSLARALLEESRRHVPHRLPITRFSHRNRRPVTRRRIAAIVERTFR